MAGWKELAYRGAVGSRDPDVLIIGSGPNGLVAACRLAMRGLSVVVLEAHPRRPGGALGSQECTLPGFVHDVGAGFFPFGRSSPALRELELERRGVVWHNAEIESCHPGQDGSVASLAREQGLGAWPLCDSPRDAERWRRLCEWYASAEGPILDALFSPLPSLRPALRLGLRNGGRLARLMLSSAGGLGRRLFESEAARRVVPSLALHVDVGPEDAFGSGLGALLGLAATTGGFAVPRGGAQSITNALITLLEERGGKLVLGARVEKVLVSERTAVGVRLADGQELRARDAVMADTSAPSLLLDLVEQQWLPRRVLRRMRRFPQGWGTFKVDFALSEPVPWSVESARRSAVVHVGEDVADLVRFTREVRDGKLPEAPYLVVGQHSLVDPTRAPEGRHTLYVYTHTPSVLAEGYDAVREGFADRITERIERLAPGFGGAVLERALHAPSDLQRENANLRGGDLGGGSARWTNQLVLRPIFPYFRYRLPVSRLYLCSAYTHPGTGVHGMCGWNAAGVLMGDIGA
ncbi:MAG: NAD(P)/FAD-dependent oxidoreductase [Polyangiaceae bacterium]|nr:NAD(P)/FAD-dependent oxidoreductase [Polyangiaceae bacterium]